MSNTIDSVKGVANEAIGNFKQGVGKAVGSHELQAEGFVQETKGEAQRAVANLKDRAAKLAAGAAVTSTSHRLKGWTNQATGAVKEIVGRVLNSPRLEADGITQQAKGKLQQSAANLKDRLSN